MSYSKTRTVQVAIGERRRPQPGGKPGYLRVDTVHQGEQTFQYGKGDSAIDVSCLVPTYVCSPCGCEWTGSDAEDIRHDAICRKLRRLTPHEILDIREQCQLSQAEFSRITGFGEASLSRWETASQIQNVACDRLLRLIKADRRNLDLLRIMAGGKVVI